MLGTRFRAQKIFLSKCGTNLFKCLNAAELSMKTSSYVQKFQVDFKLLLGKQCQCNTSSMDHQIEFKLIYNQIGCISLSRTNCSQYHTYSHLKNTSCITDYLGKDHVWTAPPTFTFLAVKKKPCALHTGKYGSHYGLDL